MVNNVDRFFEPEEQKVDLIVDNFGRFLEPEEQKVDLIVDNVGRFFEYIQYDFKIQIETETSGP
jgi:hypothetical protein